jgi:hypothetical protein
MNALSHKYLSPTTTSSHPSVSLNCSNTQPTINNQSSADVMSKLIRRLRNTQPPATKKFNFLALPAEIRLAVYNQIAPDGFLPHAHYRDYIGLFLSCQQVRIEMSHESLRIAPSILSAIQDTQYKDSLKIRPLCPVDFASLMHVSIGIPRWALLSSTTLLAMFSAMAPLFELHLSSLTIGLDELECGDDIFQALDTLSPHEQAQFEDALQRDFSQTSAISLIPDEFGVDLPRNHYAMITSYSDIVELAMMINCVVAPELCAGKHAKHNSFCARAWTMNNMPVFSCNIRRIAFRLKTLDPERHCVCGALPHHAYPFKSVLLRLFPNEENGGLRKEGWWTGWSDEQGISRTMSRSKMPSQFVWVKREGRDGRLKRAVKGLLKRE